MKILHTVQRYHPDSGGSEEVVKQLSEYLVTFGHEVIVATSPTQLRQGLNMNGVRIAEFDCSGNSVEGIRGEAERYREFISSEQWDVMMNYAAQIWLSDLVYDLLPSLRCKKVFVPCGFSRLSDPLFQSYFDSMPRILQSYDCCVYLSENYIDKKFADEQRLTNSVVIPNGADFREFHQVQAGEFRRRHGLHTRLIAINVSNHSSLKNHKFFWNCVRQLERDGVTGVLIGNAYYHGTKKWLTQCYSRCRIDALRSGGLLLEGLPRPDVVAAYTDADVFLFGSLVECSPLVMFESFASKTLLVTTDCGNVKDYEDVACVVGSESEAIEIVREFRSHPERFTDRIERGYRLFLDQLNWEAIARQYESLYKKLVETVP